MKLHPLHSPELLNDYVLNTGEYFPPERATGRTEQQALKWVAQAMHTPHQWHKVSDHHGTEPANRMLLDRCRTIVHKMGYEHFQFRPTEIYFGVPKWQE